MGTMASAARRTSGFALRSTTRALKPSRSAHPDIPARYPRPGALAGAFAEEVLLALASSRGPSLHQPELERIAQDTRDTLDLFDRRGILTDPASYHRAPPCPRQVQESPEGRHAGLPYSRVSFESDYVPLPGMPGADRWQAQTANGRCHAHVLRHPDDHPRPWLVYLHAYNMGGTFDLRLIQAASYYRNLGFNILVPVHPLHGARREAEASLGMGLLSFDWVANVHGLTQAVSDVRSWLEWVRQQGATGIALHGISLGGYLAALVAGLEPDLGCVIAGLPAATVHRPMMAVAAQSSEMRRAMEHHDLLGPDVETVHRVVTPTAFECLVPQERRFIYAGLADRIATPLEPYLLWKHWDEPRIHWSDQSHVGSVATRGVRRFVREAIESTVV